MLCAQKQKLRLHLIGNPRIPSENYTFISIKGGIPDRLKLPIRLSGGPPLIDRGNLKSPFGRGSGSVSVQYWSPLCCENLLEMHLIKRKGLND
ncbi:hypothetical protein SADUNF_SadunfMtG0001300 (mitochondrion) [Salix dunnii]|uniref:Uncharacterized protein n=1 Tax=Salix dunnii TaxID=1413687 RepID=A0A835J044_9ROSI|nr:hypothetical protein SADUNF_SadunfMtG0001300 [Salix dunnii]